MNTLHVKSGDTVVVLSGKDKGKQGKVLSASPKKGTVIVEGVAVTAHHQKPQLFFICFLRHHAPCNPAFIHNHNTVRQRHDFLQVRRYQKHSQALFLDILQNSAD